jgi:hypothetical protein
LVVAIFFNVMELQVLKGDVPQITKNFGFYLFKAL